MAYPTSKIAIKAVATATAGEIAAAGGKKPLQINNHLIQDIATAQAVADSYLSDYKTQKKKLVVTRPTPPPYSIGDTITIKQIGAILPYYPAATAKIGYKPAAEAEHYYKGVGIEKDMIIRKLNISFSAGNYVSVLELEN